MREHATVAPYAPDRRLLAAWVRGRTGPQDARHVVHKLRGAACAQTSRPTPVGGASSAAGRRLGHAFLRDFLRPLWSAMFSSFQYVTFANNLAATHGVASPHPLLG